MKKIIIAAVSDNWAIGKDNKMPWHIPADLYWFKEVTTGHPVIMGSNTYKSIGKPLPNRTNIVISHKYISGVVMAHNLKEAYSIAEKIDDQCFIIGGAQIYKSAINDADELYVTHVHTIVEDADTFFPEIDPEKWEATENKTKVMRSGGIGGVKYQMIIYKRK